MKIADVVVGKPGGLMISECMALGKRMVLTDPIPGQEKRNAEFMARCGGGRLALDAKQIVIAVRESLHCSEIGNAPGGANASAKILEFFK